MDDLLQGMKQIELQDTEGIPIPGHSLKNCDEISRIVTWKNVRRLPKASRHGLRLKIVMKDADLYSLKFDHDVA